MTAINVLLACVGGGITLMVVIGMVFLMPRGVEPIVETPLERAVPREEPEVGLEAKVAPQV
jgi:hypothetical protein